MCGVTKGLLYLTDVVLKLTYFGLNQLEISILSKLQGLPPMNNLGIFCCIPFQCRANSLGYFII